MRITRKIISLALALVIVLGLMPVFSAAASEAGIEDIIGFLEVDRETGKVITKFNYQAETSPTEIVIPREIYGTVIEEIGDSAFEACGLTKVEFEEDSQIKIIGEDAFSGNQFTEITLPAGLTTIGAGAFNGCPLEGTVEIPGTVTAIEAEAFGGMKPESVLDMRQHRAGAIAGAPWAAGNATIIWDAEDYINESDFIFNKDTGLIAGLKPEYNGSGDITIPTVIYADNEPWPVKGLADGAFASMPSRDKVTSVCFEEGITEMTCIPDNAFFGAFNLQKITNIPESVTHIMESAFRSTGITGIILPENVVSVGGFAFFECHELTDIIFQGDRLNFIADNAFSPTARSIENIRIEKLDKDSVSGAPWNAFYTAIHWQNETTAPQIVTDETGLWEFMPLEGTIVKYIGEKNEKIQLIIPTELEYNGVKTAIETVGSGSFGEVTTCKLGSLIIPDGIKAIGAYAFGGIKIGVLDLGNTVEIIGEAAFDNCGLTSLALPEALTEINEKGFSANDIKGEVIIPGNVTFISPTAFEENPEITKFVIKQYRRQVGDGEYNDIEGKYFSAQADIVGDAPYGAENASDRVYFMDDPMPVYSYQILSDAENNTATLKLSVIISDNSPINAIEAVGLPQEMYSVSLAPTGGSPSTVEMLIPSTSGNGAYSFETLFLNGVIRDYCDVPVEVFHDIIYNGNLKSGGKAPTEATGYVEGCTVTLADEGTLTKDKCVFLGWSMIPTINPVESLRDEDEARIISALTVPDNNTILYAVWAKDDNEDGIPDYNENTYALRYDRNGAREDLGMPPASVSGYLEGDVASLTASCGTLVRSGCIFYGWSLDADTDIIYTKEQAENASIISYVTFTDKDVTVYAVWAADKNGTGIPDVNEDVYNISYFGNGATGGIPTDDFPYLSGMEAVIRGSAGEIERAGYTFKGWNTAENGRGLSYKAKDIITISEDLNLYAQWTINLYTVSFNEGEKGTMTPVIVMKNMYYDRPVGDIVPKITEDSGYKFIGWRAFMDGADHGLYTSEQIETYTVKGDVTFIAQYAPIGKASVSYAVENGALKGSVTEKVKTGKSPVNIPTVNANTGYTFRERWICSLGGEYTTDELASYVVIGNVTFTAVVTSNTQHAKSFTLTFDPNGGDKAPEEIIIPNGTVVSLATMTAEAPEGQYFVGWASSPDDDNILTALTIDSDKLIYAQYQELPEDGIFAVSFDKGEIGNFTSKKDPLVKQNIAAGQCVAELPEITAEDGFAFVGWQINGEGPVFTDEAVKLISVTESVSYVAAYAKTEGGEGPRSHILIFKSNGGISAPGAIALAEGSLLNVEFMAAIPQGGLRFIGWFTKAVGGDPVLEVSFDEDTTIYAQYESVNTFTVSFCRDDGETTEINSVTELVAEGGTVSEVPVPDSDNGATVIYWQIDGHGPLFTREAILNIPVTDDVEYVAVYSNNLANLPSELVTLSFDTAANNGFGELEDVIAPAGSEINLRGYGATAPVGHSFIGWSETPNGTPVAEVYTLDNNTTLFALYALSAEGTNYAVTFKEGINGSITGNPVTFIIGEGQGVFPGSIPAVTPDTGYEFVGWQIEGGSGAIYAKEIISLIPISSNVTFIAYCAEVQASSKSYTLAFNADIGSNAPVSMALPAGKAVDVRAFTAVPPSGYVFIGWMDEGDNTVSAIPMNGNRTLTARYACVKPSEASNAVDQMNDAGENGSDNDRLGMIN